MGFLVEINEVQQEALKRNGRILDSKCRRKDKGENADFRLASLHNCK